MPHAVQQMHAEVNCMKLHCMGWSRPAGDRSWLCICEGRYVCAYSSRARQSCERSNAAGQPALTTPAVWLHMGRATVQQPDAMKLAAPPKHRIQGHVQCFQTAACHCRAGDAGAAAGAARRPSQAPRHAAAVRRRRHPYLALHNQALFRLHASNSSEAPDVTRVVYDACA